MNTPRHAPDPPLAPGSHFEATLQHDIDLIRAKFLEMLALDEQALTRAFHAFLRRDRQLAYAVILRDKDVDALETTLDHLCLEFIIRHQPAAGHLRFVYAASKIVNLMERVGDYAESIARQALQLSSIRYDVPTDKFTELADLAVPMLHDALRAFVDRDPELARATMTIEPRVNQARDELTAQLVDWREQGRLPTEALTPLVTIARRLERVSDQATNICEQALYFATGEDLKHAAREGFRILFVDDSNGCLSRMALAVAGGLAAPRFTFDSAGISAGPVDPEMARFLASKGFDVTGAPSKSVAETKDLEAFDVIVALTKEAEKAFPHGPSKTLGLRWLSPDPCQAEGSPAERQAEFERAFQAVDHQTRDLIQAILGEDEIPQAR